MAEHIRKYQEQNEINSAHFYTMVFWDSIGDFYPPLAKAKINQIAKRKGENK